MNILLISFDAAYFIFNIQSTINTDVSYTLQGETLLYTDESIYVQYQTLQTTTKLTNQHNIHTHSPVSSSVISDYSMWTKQERKKLGRKGGQEWRERERERKRERERERERLRDGLILNTE